MPRMPRPALRPPVLDVKYRGRNIAEVLDMTAREAFTFFRGQRKVQAKLKFCSTSDSTTCGSASRRPRYPAAKPSG